MKIKIFVSISTILLVILSLNVIAQNNYEHSSSLQLDFGLYNTLHYSTPVSTYSCQEGCFPLEQKARMSNSLRLNYYKKINFNNEVSVGLGYSEYRFWESGMASNGANDYYPYESIIELNFYNFSIGHRYWFDLLKKLNLYFENNLLYEHYRNYNFAKKGGFAIKTGFGTVVKLTKKTDLNLSGFYKSGINDYNEKESHDKYIPYGYGVEIGIRYKI